MAADEEFGAELLYQALGPGAVSAGIAADMYHQNTHPFSAKPLIFRAVKAQFEIVGIAMDGNKRLECSYFLHCVQAAANIAAVPYFIHGRKKVPNSFRKQTVGIGNQTNVLHRTLRKKAEVSGGHCCKRGSLGTQAAWAEMHGLEAGCESQTDF